MIPIERVRHAGEAWAADQIRADTWLADWIAGAERSGTADPDRIRRELLARSLRLTEGMAPDAWKAATAAATALCVTEPLELYQASGAENAAVHMIASPVVVEVRGRLLTLLGDGERLALFGHELGHHLAHGPTTPDAALGLVAWAVLERGAGVPEHAVRAVSRLMMAREITADRFGLLAAPDLDAALRLELVVTTGLAVDALAFDTVSYLEQCKELVADTLARGEAARGTTHPEHGVRAWAVWLFSETDVYRELTGRGPGTRTVAEVDELVAAVLRGAGVDDLVDSVLALDPVPEVHECALACAAMVALADDGIAEEELLAIERAFAPLVRDWQRYLSWDNAHEAFADTGVVIVRGGARAQRSVLQIMLQVALADGQLLPREVNMIGAIGDALGCGTLFRSMLAPVLRRLGLEPPVAGTGPAELAMPARAEEADAALAAFLDGVVRRGGGETSVRRLLRLLGDPEGHAASLDRLRAALQDRRIEVRPGLHEAERDRPLTLEVPREEAPAVAEPPPPADTEPARQRLAVALRRLRDQLVSGDGRSPSIRLRVCRTGRSFDLATLEGLSVGHAERVLTLVQARQRARVVDGREVGVHDGAKRVADELLALEREALLRHEQTGARDLYVGEPFLSGVFFGYLVRGPLILHAVDVQRAEGRGYALVPRPDEPPLANQALIRLLFTKKQAPFPEALGDRLDEAAASGVEALREVLAAHGVVARPESDGLVVLEPRDEAFASWPDGRVVIERAAVLGFFPQSTSDLIQDYDRLLEALQTTPAALGEALGAAGPLLPAELRQLVGLSQEHEALEEGELVAVVQADPSQRSVLEEARRTRTLVVDGPPGTGKSQVIVNLVADALARGRSVAVVCEKRAALDVVVQRLDQLGLRHLLAVVHDVHEDRRALYDQVTHRLSESLLRDHVPGDATRAAEDEAALVRALGERREALARALGDGAPSLGQLHLLASSFTAPPLRGLDPTLVRLPHAEVRRLARRIGREALHADLHGADSPWRPPADQERPSLADLDGGAQVAVEETLRAARDTARQLGVARDTLGLNDEGLRAAEQGLREVVATREVRVDRPGQQAFLAWLARGEDGGAEGLLRQAVDAWATADWEAEAPEPVRFDQPPELEAALVVVEGFSGRIFRFFSLAWWQARAVVRTLAGGQWPTARVAPLDRRLVERVRLRHRGSLAWKALEKLLAALELPAVLPDVATARAWVQRLSATHAAARRLIVAEAALRAVGAWPGADLAAWDAAVDARLELLRLVERHRATFAPARERFPWWSATPPSADVHRLYEAWATDAARVAESDRGLDAAASLHPSARALVRALADSHPGGTEGDWADALEHGWAVTGVEAIERRHPTTRRLDEVTSWGEVPEAEARLAEVVAERARLRVGEICAARDRIGLLTESAPEHGQRRNALQKARESMLREAGKKRYVLSLRAFAREFAEQGLTELLPVWLVSPETMAVLFPARPVFDLVVMDEASQCTVEKGFPALVRGRRAVIAGDEKQMPPSSYFDLRTPGEEEAVASEQVLAEDALSAESLLVLARQRCPHTGLRWHYRCAREELIAFSNHAMYGGDLFTIPSVATRHATPAVHWEAVPDGAYDKGANPIEAERVVDLLSALLQEEGAPSLGVVTFNVQQRRVVLDRIDARAEADPAFGARWAAATTHQELDRRPFVKNLESVQGDERDVILFSLGHAPVERTSGPLAGQRHVPARFGPLGQIGGERRLNVAVSRARQRCVVVCSFEPSMLSVAGSTHEGPKLLKAFLEFVWDLTHGRRLQAEKTLERVRQGGLGAVRLAREHRLPVPPLAAQIGRRLEAMGLRFDLDVGSSGFRVPLAVHHPDDPGRYVVAVLTDDGADVGDVVERHVHHPTSLGYRGWTVVRVTSRAWHREPDAVLRRVVDAVRRG